MLAEILLLTCIAVGLLGFSVFALFRDQEALGSCSICWLIVAVVWLCEMPDNFALGYGNDLLFWAITLGILGFAGPVWRGWLREYL